MEQHQPPSDPFSHAGPDGRQTLSSVSGMPADPETLRAQQYREMLDAKVRRMYPVSVALFFAACASTWYVGGPLYAAGVMGILLAHELGHFIQSRRYGVPASPPMFIPMPFMILGTMGAVIFQGAGFAHRKALFDIAITGPLAGLVIAIPVTWYGLQDSRVVTVDPDQQALIFGDPLILQWMYESKHGELGPNEHIELNPLLFAGWVGIFITALNLLPIGQLDGGHILYALIRRKAHWVAYAIVAGAVAWMISQEDPSFALMLVLLLAIGVKHPPSANDAVPLDRFRHVLGWLTLAFILIGFTPSPIQINGGSPDSQSSGQESALQLDRESTPSEFPADDENGRVWTIPMRRKEGAETQPPAETTSSPQATGPKKTPGRSNPEPSESQSQSQ